MSRKEKIPGDVLKVMRKVENENLQVSIKFEGYEGKVPMTRGQFTNIMKSEYFLGNNVTFSGFYLVDEKLKTAKLVHSLGGLSHSTPIITIDGRTFKVQDPRKDLRYITN